MTDFLNRHVLPHDIFPTVYPVLVLLPAMPSPPPTPPGSDRNFILFRVADRAGRFIAELEPQVGPMSWRLNGVGQITFSLAASDPKAIEDYLQFGNRVLLQFSNGLPEWGGVIDTPRKWTADGRIECTAYSGEHLLSYRQTDQGRYFSAATVGKIYQALILEANAVAQTGITVGTVWTGGDGHSPEYHYHNLLEIIQDSLTKRLSDADFYVEPGEASGYVTFTAHLYERRGSTLNNVVLMQGQNVAEATLTEQGPIVNGWVVVGEGTGWGASRPVSTTAPDMTSMSAYGLRENTEIHAGMSLQTSLDATAENLLAESAYPRNILTVSVVNETPARYADYDVGDIVRLMLHSYGFTPYDHLVRVLTREYDPWTGRCTLVVEEWE
jgi:hypothetical protein